MKNIEYLPIVDAEGHVLGKALRSRCHNPENPLMHPVVHLHVVNSKHEILLQKRSIAKLIQPGKWDTAVGGHVDYGETIAEALLREASEEIGLRNFTYKQLARYEWKSTVEHELVYSFIARVVDNFQPIVEVGEADELRFWTPDDICINTEAFTSNFMHEFHTYLMTVNRS